MQCLCDTVPGGQTCKRNRKSVDRTLKFLDDILEHRKNSDILKCIDILGCIEGGDSETERTRSAVETSKRNLAGKVGYKWVGKSLMASHRVKPSSGLKFYICLTLFSRFCCGRN